MLYIFYDSQPSGSDAELLVKRDGLISTLLEMLKSVDTSPATAPLIRTNLNSPDKKRYSFSMVAILLKVTLD